MRLTPCALLLFVFVGCVAETVSPAPVADSAGLNEGGACPGDRKACGDLCIPLEVRSSGFWWDCNGDVADGCEVDAFTDPHNCGYCGNDCDAAHGEGTCARGYCTVMSCQSGWYDCDDDLATGCESDTPCE